jgi:teichoic acid transport system ATP-binding protein
MEEHFAIRVSNLTKSYKLYERNIDRVKEVFNPFKQRYHHTFNALTDVSLDIHPGETVGIVGRNGSGKSTLLQIISGVLKPTAGTVETRGRISALLELGAGFNPDFTGRQNVYINAGILGMSSKKITAVYPQICEFAGIGDFIEQPVKTYSSGMYVRLAFAVAINVKPDILIVDEALAVGDTIFQSKCFSKFKEFQENGVTIIFVTHSLDLVVRYCTTAYLLEQGKIRASGKPKSVMDEYNRLIVNCSKRNGDGPESSISSECLETSVIKRNLQWQALFRINPKQNRYGNGRAEIIEAGIFTISGDPCQSLLKGEWYEFKMKVKFNDTIRNPIFAYTIKDVKGLDLSGTNTYFQNIDTGLFKRDEIALSVFKQKILINQGGYLISFGCAGFEDGEYLVYDRRYDYLPLDVLSRDRSVGLFDMESEIAVIRVQ